MRQLIKHSINVSSEPISTLKSILSLKKKKKKIPITYSIHTAICCCLLEASSREGGGEREGQIQKPEHLRKVVISMISGKLFLCFHGEKPENSQTAVCTDSSGWTAGEKPPTNVPLQMFCCNFILA